MKKILFLVFVFAFAVSTLAFAAEWAGQIVKSDDGKVSFKIGDNNISIANPDRVAGFEGSQVIVWGSLNAAADTVTVERIEKKA